MKTWIWIVSLITIIATILMAQDMGPEQKVEVINFEEPLVIDVPIYMYAYEPLEIKVEKKFDKA